MLHIKLRIFTLCKLWCDNKPEYNTVLEKDTGDEFKSNNIFYVAGLCVNVTSTLLL